MTLKELASRLRLMRRAEAIDQRELAARSGVSVAIISEAECGHRKRISVMQLVALVDACEWHISVFLGEAFEEELAARRRSSRERFRADDREMDRRALAMMRESGDPRPLRSIYKLPHVIVDEVRERLSAGESQSALANELGVTRQAIWQIAHPPRAKSPIAREGGEQYVCDVED